jgi:hypothetical protein
MKKETLSPVTDREAYFMETAANYGMGPDYENEVVDADLCREIEIELNTLKAVKMRDEKIIAKLRELGINTILVVGWSATGWTTTLKNSQGEVIARCVGCGYDKKGQVLGDYLEKFWQPELTEKIKPVIEAGGYYGCFIRGDGSVGVDGAAGDIYGLFGALGLDLRFIVELKGKYVYEVRELRR